MSNEQAYQEALRRAVGGWHLEGGSKHVIAELVPAESNPHMRKDSARVVEVQVDGRTVGYLTKKMSDRFLPMIDAALAEGKRTTCEAAVFAGNRAVRTSSRPASLPRDAAARGLASNLPTGRS